MSTNSTSISHYSSYTDICKNGYMIMNFGWNLPNLYTVEELKKELKNLFIKEENPKTGPQNCLLIWKK